MKNLLLTDTGSHPSSNRRRFIKQIAAAGLGGLLLDAPGLFAEQLTLTPEEQTEGPYYPTTLPLDTDNDLLVINSNLTPAVGQVTYISGRILSPSGEPVRNAYMEIWHADNTGAYIHPSSNGYATRDLNFQGFGRFLTSSSGEYLFRTIKPGLYTGRTRHIHFKVKVSKLYGLGPQWNPRRSGPKFRDRSVCSDRRFGDRRSGSQVRHCTVVNSGHSSGHCHDEHDRPYPYRLSRRRQLAGRPQRCFCRITCLPASLERQCGPWYIRSFWKLDRQCQCMVRHG
ncbi:MAG: hypothetical protein DMG13_29420 [Acidobacteria bacterium]|nr:MAG: hypothetical protein DMG13_29420 [Acidobacteriota bacterium]